MEYDIGALPGELEADFMSDPGIGTGDQRFFPMQSWFLRHIDQLTRNLKALSDEPFA